MRQRRYNLARGALGLAAFLLVGCASQQEPPATLPAPGDLDPAESVDAAEPGGTDETLPPGAEPAPEDVLPPDMEGEGTEVSPEEIDRELRALLGPDPLGLARLPGEGTDEPSIPLEMNERVEAWIHYFQNVIPERFGLYLQRAGRYEGMVRRKLREAGMPQDLLYLALIESGMNPNAYSRAAAVGMWQFIRGTARLYDMEVSFWVDERRDWERATDAAIAYLSDLHDEFGSWYLAAAAYNGGPGRIRRGLARVEGGTFWDLAETRLLRSETRNYVPKLIAAAIIGRDPARYGFGHVRPDPPLEFDIVEVPDATSFDVLADAAETDESTIRALNPQFPRRVTPPGRRVALRVPAGTREAFTERYAAIPPDKRVTWLVHTITRGQTLSHIAGRYGTSVAALQAANPGVNPRRLRIGQRLIVPRSGGAIAARAASSGAVERPAGPLAVTVRRGDTLWSIARRYGVSTRQLMTWNNLRSSVIKPGDRLQVRR